MKKIIVAVMVIALFTGCATIPTHEKMMTATEGYSLPKQGDGTNTLLYVVRPAFLGTAIRFNVFLDDKEDASEMGYTRGGQYIYFYAAPGKHVIYSKAENWAEINVDCKAGNIIFIKQNPEMGVIMARNSLELIPELEGKYWVKIADGPGEIKKERNTDERIQNVDKIREGNETAVGKKLEPSIPARIEESKINIDGEKKNKPQVTEEKTTKPSEDRREPSVDKFNNINKIEELERSFPFEMLK